MAAGVSERTVDVRTTSHADATSWVIALLVVPGISATAALFVDPLWHWFLLPVTAAGVLIGVDVAAWARQRLDVLEPRSLVALFGFHMVYISPILAVAWDSWPLYVDPARDWRASLGVLSCVNVAGLAIYRAVVGRPTVRPGAVTALDPRRFKTAGTWAVVLGLGAFALLVMQNGGPFGYLSTVANRDSRAVSLEGRGWVLLLAESWPLVLFAMIVVGKRERLRSRPAAVVALLVAFVVVQFLVGGLRGSRSNTVWPTLIALGMVNLLVMQVRRKMLVLGTVALLLFVWLYGFYKAVGPDALKVVTGERSTSELSAETGRSLDQVVLGDFSRAGIQAIVVDRVDRGEAGPLAHGGTYLGDMGLLVPSFVDQHLPGDKVVVGTRVTHGSAAVAVGFQSSSIYGLTGEAIMNFGLYGAALMWLPFALFVRFATRVYLSAKESGGLGSSLIGPALAAAAILALGSDFDNFLWFVVKQVLPIAAVVWVARRRAETP